MSKIFVFDPRNPSFKNPSGAVTCGGSIDLSVKVDRVSARRVVAVFSGIHGEVRAPMLWDELDRGFDKFSASVNAPDVPQIVWYYFEFENEDGGLSFFGRNGVKRNRDEVFAFRITVYSKDYETPAWFSEGVTYHVFVDRFFRAKSSGKLVSDEDFYVHSDLSATPRFLPNEYGEVENKDIYGGDLVGICEKLPYLHSLGVKTIYLSPIFESWSNHKYDTADYRKVDSHFGNEKILKKLCSESAKYGIRVILDGVFSHTGSDSVYFNKKGRYGTGGAWQNTDSEYRKWYSFGEDGRYSSWWGIETLPQVNELDDDYLNFIIRDEDSVIAHWMKNGVSGWRLDVADELPDEFIALLKKRVREIRADAMVIGEVWEDASIKEAYGVRRKYFTEGVLDGVMNYPIKDAILSFLRIEISAAQLRERFCELLENYPEPSQRCLMNIIGTHDTVRAINALSVGERRDISKEKRAEYVLNDEERTRGKTRLLQAATLQYMFPGSPCIYYGDEIGMEGFEDPFNRAYFTWERRDEEIFDFYRALGNVKISERCMHDGAFKFIFARGNVVAVMRGELSGEAVIACVNRGPQSSFLKLDRSVALNKRAGNGEFKKNIIKVPPFSTCVFVKE